MIELSSNVQKGQSFANNEIDRKLAKLNQDSEIYNRNMLDLKTSLREVQGIFESLQNDARFNRSDGLVHRLESKINYLQNQIQTLGSQVDRQASRQARNITPSHSPGRNLSHVTASPNLTGITRAGLPYNQYNKSEGYKENKSEERNYQTKSPNDHEYPKSADKFQYSNNNSPYSNKGNVSVSHNSQGSGSKYKQITKSAAKSVGIPITNSNKKYYGDPKIKNIIEEFHRSKNQKQEISASKSLQNEGKYLVNIY